MSNIDDEVLIRPAREDDVAAIAELLTDNQLPVDGVPEALSDFLVAESAQQIVGVVGLEICCRQHALLRSTAVARSWRNRGLGRRLVQRAISTAEGRGVDALYLLTTTAEHYFPAFGFQKVARDVVPDDVRRSVEFTSACPASATAMTLRLR